MAGDPERFDPLPGPLGLPAFLLRKLSPGRRRAALAGLVLLVLVGAGAALTFLPEVRSRQRAEAGQEARAAAQRQAGRRAAYARQARPRAGRGPRAAGRSGPAALAARRRLLAGLEGAILVDARQRARRGELRGRYGSVACFEFPKRLDRPPPADDLSSSDARLECIAVTSRVEANERTGGSLIGQPFRARISFDSGRYAWCKIVQIPGELAIARAGLLRIPRACGGGRP